KGWPACAPASTASRALPPRFSSPPRICPESAVRQPYEQLDCGLLLPAASGLNAYSSQRRFREFGVPQAAVTKIFLSSRCYFEYLNLSLGCDIKHVVANLPSHQL